jgi:hypothetical protein
VTDRLQIPTRNFARRFPQRIVTNKRKDAAVLTAYSVAEKPA